MRLQPVAFVATLLKNTLTGTRANVSEISPAKISYLKLREEK